MNEAGVWQTVRSKAPDRCWLERVENCAGEGIPDVRVMFHRHEGWIELKHVSEWPKTERGKVAVEIQRGQIPWHSRYWHCGGRSAILARVADEWFVFAGKHIKRMDAGLNRQQWRDLAQLCSTDSTTAIVYAIEYTTHPRY